MKQGQLDIFGPDKQKDRNEIFGAPAVEKPKRPRKPREVKKAPMIMDSYSPEGTGIREQEKTSLVARRSSLEQRTENREQISPDAKLPHIHTVTEITRRVKSAIEGSFADVWISGEVTDLKNKNGRHLYFALKDESSKIRAVIFNAEGRKIPFELKDGLEVVAHGNLDVYAPQGSYSIIIDFIEPKGIGALQLAFEQLKKKLEAEGLFDHARKRPIPYLPRRIGVVTSPTGAAVRDVVHVLQRRFPNIEILLNPVRVQGEGSAAEIANAIGEMNLLKGIDVLIVGRGGGSIEDLWAFNEEIVARAIAASRIPVISAVGHEIDFTIADFVADVRAATPSAAAEIAVPVKTELVLSLADRRRKLILALNQSILNRANEIKRLAGRIADPRRRLPDFIQRVDGLRERLLFSMRVGMEKRMQIMLGFAANLSHLSPLGILAKGYAVAQTSDGRTVRSSKTLKAGDELSLRFHEGAASAKVVKVN